MNCQTFEPTINDLARGRMMDAVLRESALKHAEGCERCHARLTDERTLSFSLRAFASSSERMQAPEQVETLLRAAFQKRKKTATGVTALDSRRPRRRRRTQWASVAAAAVVAICAAQAFRPGETPTSLQSAGNAIRLSQIQTPLPALASSKEAPSEFSVKDEVAPRSSFTQTVARRGRAALAPNHPAASVSNSRGEAAEAKQPQGASEIVTDFMPLTYGQDLSPNEGGQLVRVELPRSALASLGLPVNADRSNERVKADVLLGHDGLARAIRFVR